MCKKILSFLLPLVMITSICSAATYVWINREHATDCTSITDGKSRSLCYEEDSQRLFKCEPTGAGNCDTSAEWKLITGASHTDGANCTAGNSPLGVDANGAVQGCFDVATQTEVNALDHSDHGDGNNCAAGSYPLGVDADGVVQSCTDATTEIDSVIATHLTVVADTNTIGHLNDTDWDIFNGKASALSGSNNQCLTDDGSGGIVSESNMTFDGTILTVPDITTSDSVTVGGSNPDSLFEVDGPQGLAIETVTGNTTLNNTHSTILVNCSGSCTITLPTAASSYNNTDGIGRIYEIKKIDADADTVTLDGNGSETIDGATTAVITTQWESLTIQSNGTSYFII